MNNDPSANQRALRLRDLIPGLVRRIPRIPEMAYSGLSVLSLLDDRYLSLGRVLEQRARRYGDRPALLFEDRSWTYAEFNAQANQLAAVFHTDGIRRGDTVVLLLENRAETVLLIAALAKLGAAASLINFNQRGEVLAHSLQVVPSDHFCIGTELLDAFEAVRGSVCSGGERIYQVRNADQEPIRDGYDDLLRRAAGQSQKNPQTTQQVRTKDHLAYIFTSGTTGKPKASIQTHKQWLRSLHWFGRINLRIRKEDVIYVSIPFFHANALMIAWASAMSGGAAIALRRKFSVSGFWEDIRKFRATCFIYIGEICRYLLHAPESPEDRSHAVSRVIGNGLRPDIWTAFKERFGIKDIYEFYGASDSNIIFTNTLNADRTVGWSPASYALVAFDTETGAPERDRKGFFRKVGTGETGLLIAKVSGLFPFQGYVNRRHNEAKLFNDVFRKGDQWFNTGDLMRDLGYGHVSFVDRVGDTFRWKGENVATAEVEHILNACPGIASCAVYGVEIPHCDGRAGMAAIRPVEDGAVDLDLFAKWTDGRLPSYAGPVFLRIVRDFDRTPTEKIKKQALQKRSFRPDDENEPVYVRLPGQGRFTRMTSELFDAIEGAQYPF